MVRFLCVAAALIAPATAAEPLRVEQRHIEQKLPGCGDAVEGCVHVRIEYVEALSDPPEVRARINAAVIELTAGEARQ